MAVTEDSLTISRTVDVPDQEAFTLFTEGFGSWYPSVYTWSGDALVFIGMEAVEGGHCFEEGPNGFRCDWGRVLDWQPPRRLLLTWQISFTRAPVPDAAQGSEIEIVWTPEGDTSTRVDFSHRHFKRHGEEWQSYLAAMASEGGWPFILDSYVAKSRA